MTAPWLLLDPLPAALDHYRTAVGEVLDEAGIGWADGPAPSIERRGRGRIAAGVATLATRVRTIGHDRLVLWPALGLADPALWPGRARTLVVVHDPDPLRAQAFMGAAASRAGAWASRRRTSVLVHSAPAARSLEDRGWAVTRVPMPLRRPRPAVPATGTGVVVLGQNKPVRDLGSLERIAAAHPGTPLRIRGRGWPGVAGWEVEDRFLAEDELDRAIDDAGVVLVPYARFFQSDIAVRAVERLRPVAGPRHPFLEELLGADWPGLCDGPDDWPDAVRRAGDVGPERLAHLRDTAWRRAVEGWRAVLDPTGPAGDFTPGVDLPSTCA